MEHQRNKIVGASAGLLLTAFVAGGDVLLSEIMQALHDLLTCVLIRHAPVSIMILGEGCFL